MAHRPFCRSFFALLLLAAGWAASACGDDPAKLETSAELFVDRASAAGLDFRHWNAMTGRLDISEIIGAGAGFLDYDLDGDLDVVAVQGEPLVAGETPLEPPPARPGMRLFRNDRDPAAGEAGLRFTDVTEASGLRSRCLGMGAASGDYDDDGFPDLYFTCLGRNQLWRNRGDGTFEDVTVRAGVGGEGFSTATTWLDYDRDGRLDLFVATYIVFGGALRKVCGAETSAPDYCGPHTFEPERDRLWHNRGDGTFREVTLEAGLGRVDGAGLGSVATDFDADGLLDLYVGNDGTENQLWHNRGDGTFEDLAPLAGAAVDISGRPEGSMGVDAGDFDGDGDEDLIAVHLDIETNTLYRNSGEGFYDDVTLQAGLARPSLGFTSFGAVFFDFDLDGDLDLFIANGAVHGLPAQIAAGDPLPLRQRAQLFENLGGGRFIELGTRAGSYFEQLEIGRGVALGDVDDDGDPDLLVANNNGPLRLLINRGRPRGHWLGLRLLTGKRDALGAQVVLERAGERVLSRRVKTDGSYLSSNDPRVLAGLGKDPRPIEAVVRWVSGRRERFAGLAVDRYTTLREGEGAALEPGEAPPRPAAAATAPAPAPPPPVLPEPSPEAPAALETIDFEPAVAAQLRAAQAAVERLKTRSGTPPAELAAAWGRLAELQHVYRLPAALASYREALRLAPTSHRLRYLAGLFAFHNQRPEIAVAELEQALALAPDDLPTQLRLAEALLERGDLAAAAQRLDTLLARHAEGAAAHALRAQVAAAMGENALAVRHYARTFELQPQASRLRRPAAAACRAVGDLACAAEHLRQAGDGSVTFADPLLAEIESKILSSQRFQELGALALRAGELPKALALFRHAVELDPERVDVQVNLAAIEAQAGDSTAAIARLEKVLAGHPGDANAHFNLAVLRAGRGEDGAALAHYRSALTARPGFFDARLNLANLLARRGEAAEAAEHYRRAAELEPTRADLRVVLARLLWSSGRADEALLAAETAVRELPEATAPLEALARLLATHPEKRDSRRARELAERAFAREKTTAVVEALAMAHAAAGDFAAAARWQEAAVAAARKAGALERQPQLLANLERYRRGEVAAQPWR